MLTILARKSRAQKKRVLCYWKKSIFYFSRKMSNNLKCPKFNYLLEITLGNLLRSIFLLEITLVIYYGVFLHILTDYNDRSQFCDWIIQFSVFLCIMSNNLKCPKFVFSLEITLGNLVGSVSTHFNQLYWPESVLKRNKSVCESKARRSLLLQKNCRFRWESRSPLTIS